MPASKSLPKFFITHAYADNAFARRLADDLRSCGLDGFFDIYSLEPGDSIPLKISQGLAECSVYVPILSSAALASAWCEEEIMIAVTLANTRGRDGRPRIIPILIERCQDKIPVILLSKLWLTFYDDYEKGLGQPLEKGFGLQAADKIQRLTRRYTELQQLIERLGQDHLEETRTERELQEEKRSAARELACKKKEELERERAKKKRLAKSRATRARLREADARGECRRCHTENPPERIFCMNCGFKLRR